MNESPKPLPDREDPDNAPFWDGTDEERLLVRHCKDCGRHYWPPRLGCPYCSSDAVDWTETAPRGKIFSWTVVHRSQTRGFEPEVPYAVLLVELDESPGVRMIGNLVDADLDVIAADLPVEAMFTPSADGSVKLVNWRPSSR